MLKTTFNSKTTLPLHLAGKKPTMRKDSPPPPLSGTTPGKISLLCFETKPIFAIILALTLVTFIWNIQPYYDNLLSTTRPCTATPEKPTPLPIQHSTTAQKISASTPKPKPTDPNKRTFQTYGNAAALFVQMGAYRGGPNTFSIVGLASKPIHVFGKPWYKCEWISNNGTSIKTKAYKMLPDWGYGRVYTVVVVNCTFPVNPNVDNSGGKLVLYAYYGQSQKKYEKIVALDEEPGSYNELKYKPPYKYDYLYCGSSLYGNLSAVRIREWMAYHAWFFGESSHFVFHDAGGISAEVRAVLEPWIRLGRVTIQDIRDQAEFDGYYYNQFLVVNDCLHRYRNDANWTFYFDVDEYIYLPDGNTLTSVLNEFKDYTQFTIEQNPMSSKLCLNESTHDYSSEWGFEKLVFRDSRTKIRRDRKYAIQARNAYSTGVHMSENVSGKTLHKTETKIRYYHYHNTITVDGEPCREFLPDSAKSTVTWSDKKPFVFDDKMKKLADTIKRFEKETLGGAVHV
ncbi:galactan beta-1,4-galactosyltransferase GALS1 [Thalictrum thalictroides]|uniref:Glycosyltransferase family 92 protein n=1 Tax=Thalictrum thalictroides TaxID=46969 RepID=A0A7J6X4S1_THATH|nr:galactan beta-1,4-galactosyltransferase GALS1 [Thalictrum thalictroides]